MQYKTIVRILGILVTLFSVSMLPPAIVAFIFKDGAGTAFIASFFIVLGIGAFFWYSFRGQKEELKAREGFILAVAFWMVLGLVSSFPLLLTDSPNLSTADAIFESFSGFTTTGASVLPDVENLPRAVQYYRQQLQWLGGMGIVVLAVAIMPILGVGGMQIYRAESPGTVKESKMTPRIADTAKNLSYIYVTLTITCILAYWAAGMDIFEAILHAFSTVSLGGFSNYNNNLAHFDNSLINMVCMVFLIISGINFSLHHAAVKSRSLASYLRDPEFKVFLFVQLVLTMICFIVLMNSEYYPNGDDALSQAAFHAISMSTTAGFSIDNFAVWPVFLPILLVFSSFVGGCAGSTGGGMKVVRIYLLFLQGMRELNRLVHPKATFTIKLGRKALPAHIVEAIWGFFSAYTLVFVFIMVLLLLTGIDIISAFTATAACLNNLGPGLGQVADNYSHLTDTAKWICAVAMVFGRLEIFTLLVLFTPTFWKS